MSPLIGKEPRARCGGCRKVWRFSELRDFSDFWSEVEVGNEIPAGECPECGVFAYVLRKPARRPRVVISVRGGLVTAICKPRGVEVIVKDFDNCPECGGVKCQGGRRADEVHKNGSLGPKQRVVP